MILSPKTLLELVEKEKLVENLSERELTNPEGTGFDLRLGEVFKISGEAFLEETHRKTPDIESVMVYDEKEPKAIKIKPGDFFLVKTIEKINLPIDLSAVILPRTTTFRSGLFIRTGPIQPGYSGELTFGLKNEGPVTVEIEMGARFVHLIFHEIKAKAANTAANGKAEEFQQQRKRSRYKVMNSAIHFEIPADDFERAQAFYKNVFGWQINAYDSDTVMVSTTESGEDGMPKNPGAINGDLFKRSPDLQHPIIVLSVDSIDEHVKKIEAAGGKLRVPKGEIPEMGYYAYFTDSEGNVMGLWENWPQK